MLILLSLPSFRARAPHDVILGKTLGMAVLPLRENYGKGDNEQEGHYELMRGDPGGPDPQHH